ncbi:hypothetical protein THASP1DRAFT_29610 [Thamnocephalis sphaerospora]|uniref:Protoporphyrinogen oxidase n=1 Tax=Thamnocephalis sphaerospora TaxID=78915 RepID=A0A4P9XR77_9FUNG|nr:hypothetical protein THASP1DRAFT_29610 [Thamnocephalis sphaerospora]|eukprot:RKP08583.1 hypothetical protein THASP1DRAFT_29610 [Thamnocephalis sphaerospora]
MTRMAAPRHFVVLGGGAAGLSAAYHLLRSASATQPRVTLLEAAGRVGGWVRSEQVPLADSKEGTILCETGPRTLRPAGAAGIATLQLVNELGLADQLLTVPHTAPAARNRYIYGDGRLHLLRPLSILRSSYVRPAVLSAMAGPLRGSSKPAAGDESLYAFVARHFSPMLAERVVSAVVSGIYAGDIHELSVRACANRLWRLERDHGSFLRGLLNPQPAKKQQEAPEVLQARALRDVLRASGSPASVQAAVNASVYSFRGGMQTLTDALVERMQREWPDQFELRLHCRAQSVQVQPDGIEVRHTGGEGRSTRADHVISALPAGIMRTLVETQDRPLPALAEIGKTSANVAVVNLTYSGRLNIPDGFGYLIPATVADTIALGVVFDSHTLPEQDGGLAITRLTVMLGGRQRWSDALDTMSEADFISQAQRTVREHLGVDMLPLDARAHVQRKCIPQYRVGHVTLLQQLHNELAQHYGGRLSLTGASYLGVSLNDCIWRAQQLAKRLSAGTDSTVTGLEAASML